LQGKELSASNLTSDPLEVLSTTSIKPIAPTEQFTSPLIDDLSDDSEASSRSPSPELALPPIVYHLYVLHDGKWVRGYAQGTIMLDNSFTEVKDEFTAKLTDKLDLLIDDSDKYKITFGTKWTVTNTRTTTVAKKTSAPVNPNDFADFKRDSCLSALIQTIRGTLKMVRGKLDAGNKQLLVLGTVVDAVSPQVSVQTAERSALDADLNIIEEDTRQVPFLLYKS
jgi:hypothetical protein